MASSRVETPAGARDLARQILSQDRPRPLVVVSTGASSGKPWIDVGVLETDLADVAEVCVIETGRATFALAKLLPPRFEVYGGAGRVYPVGRDWREDVRQSPLRFAFDPVTGRAATDELVSDGLRMASAVRLVVDHRSPQTTTVSGVVKWIDDERAIVRLADGTTATVARELTLPDVPLSDVLSEGMPVTGTFDPESKRLDVTLDLRSVEESLRGYAVGALVLARVEEVRRQSVRLLLYPGVEVWLRAEQVTTNDLDDDLRELLTVGDSVAAHVVATGPDWALRLDDVDDDEVPLPAPPLIDGGPPWLAEPDDQAWLETHPHSEPVEPQLELPHPPPELSVPPAPKRRALQDLSLKVESLNSENARLQARLAAITSEHELLVERLKAVHRENAELKSDLSKARKRALKRSKSTADDLSGLFTSPEDQLRFEIDYAWALRIAPGDKPDRPLAPYSFAPGFLESVDQLEGITRKKIVEVLVEVLTGLAAELPARKLRRLRSGDAGGAPDLVRSDGARAMRVNLQTNTASARRLHYWQLGNQVEFAKVAVHDDFTM